jgi:hypothetical protein
MSNREIVVVRLANNGLLALTAALLLAVSAGCGVTPTATPLPTATPSPAPPPPTMVPQHGWELPAEEYVFIDHHIHIEGTCIEGECQLGPMIDFPTYTFDFATDALQSWLPVEVDDALKVIYGDGTSLSGAAGGGAGTGLTEVYTIPAELEDLRIVQVDRDGTAYLEYKGELLVLASGQTWTNTTEEVREQGAGKARLTTTDRLVNYGVLDKAKILFPTPQP